MADIRVLEKKTDCKEVLEHAIEQADGLDCLVILSIKKDGTLWLRSSSMSAMEKMYLMAFYQHFCLSWFRDNEQ